MPIPFSLIDDGHGSCPTDATPKRRPVDNEPARPAVPVGERNQVN
jgi:hypothetical protein